MKMRLVLTIIGLLGLCAFVAADQPPYPIIPTEYSTSVNLYLNSATGTVLNLQGYQNYSLSFELSRFDFTWGPPDSPQYPLHTIVYEAPGKTYYDTNQVCRNWPGTFTTIFAFVPYSEYIGQQTINGRVADGWYYAYKIPTVGTSYLTLWSQGNSPVQWNSTFVGKGLSSVTVLNYGPDFHPTTFTPQQKQYFTAPKRCAGDGYLCPGPSKVMNMTMIRIHPSDNYNLTNKNTADVSGDAFFICGILSSDAHNYDTLISVFEVQVNSSFGRYGKCNGGHCVGSNNFSVGRAATWGVKPFGGQCANNSDTGTWYSMGGEAECPDGSPIGTNQCAWKTLARKKTIDLNCAASLGMLDACTESPSIPVPLASDVLVRALQTCPDVPPPSSSSPALKPLRNKTKFMELDHDSFPLDATDLFMRNQHFISQIISSSLPSF